ncbi:hypothetical protein LHJ74_16675 [Streptomyces sp. N2-109]|uniref:Uncharacterized protein n=1 Tax=Streptomyces gossypii TaxID=2883101 RepID=A0ABT2JUG4_9ACTN|nr:hypothetical protein [Streptomyces gossypii]MCT2591515.1 hypothetical protein [Streptomyces gossypii]
MLRASGFMQNFLRPHPLGEQIGRHREIRTAAGDGRPGWIDARDIAAAASALLTETGADADDQRDYLLTGPKALSYGDVTAVITAEPAPAPPRRRMPDLVQARRNVSSVVARATGVSCIG